MEPRADKESVLEARVRFVTTGDPARVIEAVNRLLRLNFLADTYDIRWD